MSYPKVGFCKSSLLVFKFVFVSAFFFLVFQNQNPARAAGDTVQISWAPSSSPILAGYNVYEGTQSGVYTNVVTVSSTTSSTNFSGLVAGTTYYFSATTFASDGSESPYSGEIVYVDGAATLTQANSQAGQFGFNVQGLSGRQYVVQSSADLQNWVTCATNTAPFQFAFTNTVAAGQQFFRAYLLE